MKMAKALMLLVLMVGFLALPLTSWAKTEIVWWHAMGGPLGERVNDITSKFNSSQGEYEVKAVNKRVCRNVDRGDCRLPGQDSSPNHPGL
jgi:sn-glycerol 3-phosphate transport system substrate-binding protein